jgi:hypothetical protein
MTTTKAKISALVNNAAERLAIYKRARVVLPHNGARCACTQSLLLIRAGVLNGVRLGTDDLDAALTARGWKRFESKVSLEPYDLLFSQDLAGRHPAPDHVYLFVQWLDQPARVALIWDNNAVGFTARNLGGACWYKGKRLNRTPFGYALRPPA